MRISDWSSDVCSSDLISRLRQRNQRLTWRMWAHALRRRNPAPGEQLRKLTSALVRAIGGASLKVDQCRREITTRCLTSAILEPFGSDRKCVVLGTSVSVRVDIGGRRIFTKTKIILSKT